MRKILAYIITLTILAGLFCSPVSTMAQETSAYAELDLAETTLIGLGIVDSDSYNPDALLSRAEFATLIARLCNFVPANKAYLDNMEVIFGADVKDELITTSDEQVFDDVDATMEEFEAINAMYAKGYMNGITPTHFGPYYDVTAGQVVKVVVSMLGRDRFAQYKGGYPDGYMKDARDIKLLAGLAFTAGDFITMRETLNLIYNAFDLNVYELTSIGTDGEESYEETDKTFLNECASLYKVEGIMTDNGVSTYYGASKVGYTKVVIGGKTINIGAGNYARAYLGRDLIAYCLKDDADRLYIAYVTTSGEDKSVTFTAGDFAGYASSTMKYYNENGKLINASLVASPKVIYNNTALTRYNADTFDFLFGDITLVSTQGNKYDVIVVNDYMVGKINKIASSDKIIYSKTPYSGMNDVKTLDLEEEDGKIIVITDANGNAVDFDALSKGNIISVAKNEDGSYISIKVCSAAVTNFELTNYVYDDKLEVSNGESTYYLKGTEELEENMSLKLGQLYDLYFDYEGNLIWMENLADSTDLKKAYLVDAAKDANGFSDTCAVKLYTEDSELAVYELDNKVILNHSSIKSDDAMAEIESAIGKMVLYRIDKETKILKAIITPLGFGMEDTDDRGWYELVPYVELSAESKSDDDQAAYQDYLANEFVGIKYSYQSNMGYLNKAMVYDKKLTTLFAVPATKDEYNNEKKFYVNKVAFQNNTSYYLNAYDTEEDSIMPSVMAFAVGGGSASGDAVTERSVFLVSKVTTIVNADEEQTKAYKGYVMDFDKKTATETTFPVSTEVEFVDSSNKVGATPVDIEPGDIIRYAVNSDNEISAIFVAYDMSEKQANPFGAPSLQWYNNDTYAGYPYSVDGNYVRITTEAPHLVAEKAEEYWYTNDKTKDLPYNEALAQYNYFSARENAVFHVLTKVILVVEEGVRGEISVRSGTADDLVSYEESGDLATESYNKIVGTETSWGHTIGTVIYK